MLLTFFLLGAAAGAITGVPIGPVNVAVIDAAYRHTLRRALATGFGGAIADGLYAALGVLGVTPKLQQYPSVTPILYGVSGVVLLFYGYFTARSQPVKTAQVESKDGPDRNEIISGFKVGLLLIVLNPAAMVTWVVIMSSFIPPASTWQGVFCSIGVSCGSFSWFVFVALLTRKGKNVLGDKAAWIPRGVGVALMFYAVYLLFRAVHYLVVS